MTIKTLFDVGDHVQGTATLFTNHQGNAIVRDFTGVITAVSAYVQQYYPADQVTPQIIQNVRYLVRDDDLTSGEYDVAEQELTLIPKKPKKNGTQPGQ